MRVLLDTSVLTSELLESHSEHSRCIGWLERARGREIELLIASHSLAELFSILTRAPFQPRISPSAARQLIQIVTEDATEVITLSAEDYLLVIRDLSAIGLSGGIVYDALIARAAEKARADRLVSLNAKHFQRLWPTAAALSALP